MGEGEALDLTPQAHRSTIAATISALFVVACSGSGGSPGAAATSPTDGGAPPSGAVSCASDADCLLPQTCSAGVCAAPVSCSPPGTPQLRNGGVAGPAQAPSACVRTVQQSTAATQKLGTHTVGDVVPFQVPAGTSSFTIVSQAVGTPLDTITSGGTVFGNTVVPTALQDPSGSVLYDDSASSHADPSGQTVFYGGESQSTGAMTVPNTSSLLHEVVGQRGLTSGTWRFTVNDWAYECLTTSGCTGGSKTDQYDIQVLTRSGTIPASGTLDVAIYLVGGSLTAASAVSDAAIARMVRTLGQLYAGAGLCLGTVTFHDVPDWAKTKYGSGLNVDDASPCGDLNQMFTLSAPGNQLNLFLVDELVAVTQNNAVVVGVDGSIPGPSTIGGTIHSGAAVSSADLSLTGCGSSTDVNHCGADLVAYIAAHEGGHWMGLYHPTELFGDAFDPLSDTPTCACTACAPASQQASCLANNANASSPTTMGGSWCTQSTTCGGGDNLMFWVISSSSLGTLTPDQGLTMRSNPLVR